MFRIWKKRLKRSSILVAASLLIALIGAIELRAQDEDNDKLRDALREQGIPEEMLDQVAEEFEKMGITELPEGAKIDFGIEQVDPNAQEESEKETEEESDSADPPPVVEREEPKPLGPLQPMAPPKANNRQTGKVTRGDMQLEVNVPGVFVADDKDEIRMEPDKYSGDLIVTRILPEGAEVKSGDVLIEFDGAEVDESIETAQNEVTDAEVELKKANAEHKSAIIDLDSNTAQLKSELSMLENEIEAAIQKQDFELAEKKKAVEDSKNSLKDLETDFETLKQVYSERGIDPENSNSGQIIINREIKSIENSKKRIQVQEKELAYFQQFDKSKNQLEKELAKVKKQAEIDKGKINLAAVVAEKKSIVDKAQRKLDAANRKVAGLQQDRKQLRVLSPRDGVVFYGTTGNELPAGVIIGGSMPDIRKELRIGGRVKTHKILLTIATMENLSIKMSLSENDIQHVKADLKISVHPNAYPKLQVEGKLTKVDQIATRTGFQPTAPRLFDIVGKCTDMAKELRSGMNCRVTIHPEPISNVLQVPIVSVFADGDRFYCFVETGTGFEAKEVKIGLSNFDSVEIRDGLAEGDVVCWAKN